MKEFALEFKGYWRQDHKNRIPRESGIYCVYACRCDSEKRTVSLRKLLFIGGSGDMRTHLENNTQEQEWKKHLEQGEELCYSAAKLGSGERFRAEAAMIYVHKPPCNAEHTDRFLFAKTRITTGGSNRFLEPDIIVQTKW